MSKQPRKSFPRNLSGLPFGRLTAKRLDHIKNRRQYWFCECECGGTKVVYRHSLLNFDTQSCGCLMADNCRAIQVKGTQASAKKNRLAPGVSLRNFLFNKYVTMAKRRKIPFTVDRAEFDRVTASPCHYCGIPPAQVLNVKRLGAPINYNGIDRINSAQGYQSGNIRPCCWRCNVAKAQMSEAEFREWISRVFAHFCTSPPK